MKLSIVRLGVGLLTLELLMLATVVSAADREARDLTGFTAISVGGGIDTTIRQGDAFQVEVVASNGDTASIVTEVRDGTLVIRHDGAGRGFFNWFTHYSASVTLPKVTGITAAGGSDIRSDGHLAGESLMVEVSGGSDAALDLGFREIDVTASGGSDVMLKGAADRMHVTNSGGSDLMAMNLKAGSVTIDSSGGSDSVLSVSDSLGGNASGGSDVVYTGSPKTVDVKTTGGSDVRGR